MVPQLVALRKCEAIDTNAINSAHVAWTQGNAKLQCFYKPIITWVKQ